MQAAFPVPLGESHFFAFNLSKYWEQWAVGREPQGTGPDQSFYPGHAVLGLMLSSHPWSLNTLCAKLPNVSTI